MIIGTAGHIDHGKTALVRALTGVDTDRLPEEKKRGITIELGFAPLELAGHPTVGIVDVPGHESFVRMMVAGATGIDVALLIVAADEGIMPQTREHFAILRLLGVQQGAVALTKSDLVDADWAELVKDEIAALLKGSALEGSPIVSTSAKTGEGIAELKRALSSLLDKAKAREAQDLFRLHIDRSFTVKGTGSVLTGTSWSGHLAVGEEVRVLPAQLPARVRGLQSHGRSVERVGPGERVAVALAGVELSDLSRGGVIVTGPGWTPVTRFYAQLDLEPGTTRPRPREWLHLHVGTAECLVRVVAPRSAQGSDATLLARVVTSVPVVLRAGDRFIVRRSHPLATIGGGVVVDPSPVLRRMKRSFPWTPNAAERLANLLEVSGRHGVSVAEIPVRVGIPPNEISASLKEAQATEVEGVAYLTRYVRDVAQDIEKEVVTFHSSHPSELGAPLAKIRSAVSAPDALFDHSIAELATQRAVELVSGLIRKKGWEPTVTGEETSKRAALLERLRGAGMEPPSVGELVGDGQKDALTQLKLLEREGLVVAVEPDRFYEVGALKAGLTKLQQGMHGKGHFAPSQIRDLLGVSRKFLMPLLEFCDRRRITERHEHGRVWLAQDVSVVFRSGSGGKGAGSSS